jgi:NADPH2:quinone reductase
VNHAGPDALQVLEEECPEPKNGEVRVRVLAAGVCLPDIMAREGVHPETPPVPFTPGWDLVGAVDRLGNGVSGIEPGQIVAALPIHGAAGGVGSALMQLGRLADLVMYGTCSARGATAVTELGGTPIDYRHQDFVQEIHHLAGGGAEESWPMA